MGGELAAGALILVEHPAVITIGRSGGGAAASFLVSPGGGAAGMRRCGVGGDGSWRGYYAFHKAMGQLVVYPIVPLNFYGLNLHGYMRLLEMEVTVGVLGRLWDWGGAGGGVYGGVGG